MKTNSFCSEEQKQSNTFLVIFQYMNSPNDSPAKTASGKDCKKCIQKGSMCVQHGGSRSPRGSSPTVRGSTAASPKKVSPRRVSSISPKKVNQGANEWEKSKFMRELTEKLESLAISPKKGSPKSKTSPKKGTIFLSLKLNSRRLLRLSLHFSGNVHRRPALVYCSRSIVQICSMITIGSDRRTLFGLDFRYLRL